MLHLAICVMLVWLAINIAYVALRMRATRSPHGGKNLNSSIAPYRPELVSQHRHMRR